MKKIKQTLTASLLACTSLNSLHAEVAPLSYGIKAFGSLSNLSKNSDAKSKVENGELSAPFMGKFWFAGMAQVEYAFTNYIGAELCVGYSSVGGKLLVKDKKNDANANNSTDENNANTTETVCQAYSHGITIPLSLCVYPLGREEDGGILKVLLGPDIYIPFSKGANVGDKKVDGDPLKELMGLDVSLRFGLSYEVLKGVSIEGYYGMGFMNRVTTLEANKERTLFADNIKGLNKINTKYIHAGVGVNLASFFQS